MPSIFNAPPSLLPAQSLNRYNGGCGFSAGPNAANLEVLWFNKCRLRWGCWKVSGFRVKSAGSPIDSIGNEQVQGGARVDFSTKALESNSMMGALHGMINDLPSFVPLVKRNAESKYAMAIYIALAAMLITAKQILSTRKIQTQHGSVVELVKRGQLRSDRRGISKPALNYEDPFNNPQVKIGKSSSKIEICGKVFRLAPVNLTQEQQLIHQRRRSQAYQWKRPTVFLKEGDPVPSDVDPDTIQWVPPNHPFATTSVEIDESFAQNNVLQKDGLPSRVRAEHEALQKKLETLQRAQNGVGISKQKQEPSQQAASLEKQNEDFSSTGNNTKLQDKTGMF